MSSVSCGSLNHEDTGTALLGWKIYDAGELSIMIVSEIGRPSCERSWYAFVSPGSQERVHHAAYLDIVPSMVVAAFSEQPMGNYVVHIQLVEHGVCVLSELSSVRHADRMPRKRTLLRLAVKTTTSYISPIFFRKLSTPGRLIT